MERLTRRPKTRLTLARRRRAIGLRVAAIDMFVDVGGKIDANAIIEVNSNPSIRLLEDFGSRRSHSGNLASHFYRHGASVVFDLPR